MISKTLNNELSIGVLIYFRCKW